MTGEGDDVIWDWLTGGRLSTNTHKKWFLQELMGMAKEQLGSDVSSLNEKMLYAEMVPGTYEEVKNFSDHHSPCHPPISSQNDESSL